MNTPAHLLLGAACFARPATSKLLLAALFGALLPDLSLYLLAGGALFLLDLPPAYVFGELYFSNLWQSIFAVDNSFVVWGVLLLVALWSRRSWAIAMCGAAILHLALDFPLHHDDGRAHFWPLTSWVFESPYSYWDRHHGAHWVAPLEAAAATISAGVLWKRQLPIWAASLVGALLVAELWVVRQWLFVFGG